MRITKIEEATELFLCQERSTVELEKSLQMKLKIIEAWPKID